LKLTHREERAQVKASAARVLPPTGLAVDDTQHSRDIGVACPQLPARLDDPTGRVHDILVRATIRL